jgi:hypothetical protein
MAGEILPKSARQIERAIGTSHALSSNTEYE